jgi:purine-binding chemotaxis protein CheW
MVKSAMGDVSAKSGAKNNTDPFGEEYLIFTIEEKYYALPSKMVGEVAVLEKIFPMPLSPAYARGLINRYSISYALIDLGFFFNNEISNTEKVIVLKDEIDKLAFLIDDVVDIVIVQPEDILKLEHDEDTLTVSINAFFVWKENHVLYIDTDELINKIKWDFDQDI